MPESQEHIDEYLLAAYLAGDLPQRLREEISAYLVANDRARDLLAMAGDALYAAEGGDGARAAAGVHGRSLRPVRLKAEEFLAARGVPRVPSDESLWKTIIVVASTVLLLTIAVAWHISSDLKSATRIGEEAWVPLLAENQFRLEWDEIRGAAAYRVVLLDSESRLAHTVGLTVHPLFHAAEAEGWPDEEDVMGPMMLWIEALDGKGELILRSQSIPVSRP